MAPISLYLVDTGCARNIASTALSAVDGYTLRNQKRLQFIASDLSASLDVVIGAAAAAVPARSAHCGFHGSPEGMTADVAGLQWGCKSNAEMKTYFTLTLLLLYLQRQKETESAASFKSNYHDIVK